MPNVNPKIKTERLYMRLSPEEKKSLETAATAAGMTIAAYVLYKLGLAAGDALGEAIIKSRKKGS